jgi:RimJ/RimL family protein N-acetyltransferase
MSGLAIKTQRLTLRPLCPGDAERIAQNLNNFAVAANLSRVPYPYFAKDAAEFLATRSPDPAPEETGFAIDLGDHGMVGSVGYHLRDGRPVLGYYLGQPYWGRGLMTEAAKAAVLWFFSVTDKDTIHSGAFSFNRPSLMVQKKLGFTETGRSTLLCLARNEEVGHIDTKLTRDAWTGTVK